jgi:methionyl aminopeptidase
MVEIKSAAEVARMRVAGTVVAEVLGKVAAAAEPGVLLEELDALAAEHLRAVGAQSSFKGYHPAWAPTPYPKVLILSVNEVVVHGIPDRRRLREGDLLSIDFAAAVEGFHADSAISVPVGSVDAEGQRLMETAREALRAGIAAAVPGGRLGDISAAVETVTRRAGYGIPDGIGGHGVGRSMHEEPSVPNTGRPGRGMRLTEGLVLAIEPIAIEGGTDVTYTRDDGWTVATADGSRAAHVEHTVAITRDGPIVLTAPTD